MVGAPHSRPTSRSSWRRRRTGRRSRRRSSGAGPPSHDPPRLGGADLCRVGGLARLARPARAVPLHGCPARRGSALGPARGRLLSPRRRGAAGRLRVVHDRHLREHHSRGGCPRARRPGARRAAPHHRPEPRHAVPGAAVARAGHEIRRRPRPVFLARDGVGRHRPRAVARRRARFGVHPRSPAASHRAADAAAPAPGVRGRAQARQDVLDAIFDPLLLSERDVAVTIAPESTLVVADSADYDSTAMAWVPVHFDTVRAFRIEQERGGVRASAWIDAAGHIVRVTSGGDGGFTMERSAFEIAYENFRRRDTARVARASASPHVGDIVATTALTAGARPQAAPLAELRVRLSGADGRVLALAGGRQRLAGDTIVVRRETAAKLVARYTLPASDTGLRAYLEAEPLIPSGNPRIRAQARAIHGRDRDHAPAHG